MSEEEKKRWELYEVLYEDNGSTGKAYVSHFNKEGAIDLICQHLTIEKLKEEFGGKSLEGKVSGSKAKKRANHIYNQSKEKIQEVKKIDSDLVIFPAIYNTVVVQKEDKKSSKNNPLYPDTDKDIN